MLSPYAEALTIGNRVAFRRSFLQAAGYDWHTASARGVITSHCATLPRHVWVSWETGPWAYETKRVARSQLILEADLSRETV